MTTKLEAMVGYLAGREGSPELISELADPSSEASRFLEATRTRSRALLEQPVTPDRPVEPAALRSSRGKWPGRLAWASSALLALGVTLGIGEARIRRLEATFERANAEGRAGTERLEVALARLAKSNDSDVDSAARVRLALGEVGANLDRLERAVRACSTRPEPPPEVEPALAELREQLATLRRDVASGEKTSTRRSEELQAKLQDVARLLRLLLDRTQPPAPADEIPPRRKP